MLKLFSKLSTSSTASLKNQHSFTMKRLVPQLKSFGLPKSPLLGILKRGSTDLHPKVAFGAAVGIAAGTAMAFTNASMSTNFNLYCCDDGIKKVVNPKQAYEAYETLKKELNIPSSEHGMDEHEQDIFLVHTTIGMKELQEQLLNMKKQHESELEQFVANDQALKEKADIIFTGMEKETRNKFQKELQERIAQEVEQTEQKLQKEIESLRSALGTEFKDTLNAVRADMSRELTSNFENLRTKSEESAANIEEMLHLKYKKYQGERDLLLENKHLVNIRERCKELETQLMSANTSDKELVEHLHSLQPLLKSLVQSAPGDEFVCTVLKNLSEQALKRGVMSEIALKERFKRLEHVAHRLALLREDGPHRGSMYLMSYLRSMLTLQPRYGASLYSTDENMDNADILYRAREMVDHGDFLPAVTLLENMQGASKHAVSGWLVEAKSMLDVHLATQVLKSYATLQIQRSISNS